MIRTYGKAPYTTAVIHGGPGDLGSLSGVAKELAHITGVIEPIQSNYTIAELIDELNDQLSSVTTALLTLIGHSWGAWLAVLYAARYPDKVEKIVVVGSGPFDECFVPAIHQRRMAKLLPAEKQQFNQLLSQLALKNAADKDNIMTELSRLIEKTDNYHLDDNIKSGVNTLPVDGEMYAAVWPQAEIMRKNGLLIEAAKRVNCPIIIIHGEYDPHPIEGITAPLIEQDITFQCSILPKCGHSPFNEKFAKAEFYHVLKNILSEPINNTDRSK